MRPNSYMFPSIAVVHPDCSIIDVRNQYSILNRMKSRDVLSSFSYDMEWRLPKINQRVRYLDEKENQLTDIENRLMVQNKYLQEFQNMLGCHCNCYGNFLFYPGHKCNHGNCKPQSKQEEKYQQPKSQKQQKPQTQPQQQPQKTKKNISSSAQNIKNERRKQALKKFRKYAYAVYFAIYLKHFSSKFTKNRYTFFKSRYLVNDGEKVKQDSFKITKSIEAINLLPLILEAPLSIEKMSKLRIQSSKVITTKSTPKLIPDNEEDKFIKAMNFVNLYLKQLQQVILSKKFIDYYAEIIGIGTLNQSFFMDELMIPQQIQFITFSEKKGFAQIDSQTEKTLIMTYLFAKHVLFKILLRLREKKYLETNLINDFGKYRGQMEKIYDFLELANGILYILVNSVFLQFLDDNPQLHTNYDSLKKRFKISPAKVLTAPDCPKEIKESINYRQLIIGVSKVDQVESTLQDLSYREYINYLMGQIQSISQRLLNQARYVNKAVYEHIKQETIKQKYLIFEGIKAEQLAKGNVKTMGSMRKVGLNDSQLAPNNLQETNNKLNGSKSHANMMSIRQLNNNTKSTNNLNLNVPLNQSLNSRISNTSLGNSIFSTAKR